MRRAVVRGDQSAGRTSPTTPGSPVCPCCVPGGPRGWDPLQQPPLGRISDRCLRLPQSDTRERRGGLVTAPRDLTPNRRDGHGRNDDCGMTRRNIGGRTRSSTGLSSKPERRLSGSRPRLALFDACAGSIPIDLVEPKKFMTPISDSAVVCFIRIQQSPASQHLHRYADLT
jgi:hypothetical protein